MREISVGILIISDRSARGERIDKCGPILAELTRAKEWSVVETAVIADEHPGIVSRLKEWCDRGKPLDIILTSGGTGLGPRDVTPEATRAVLDREIPGLSERMRREGEAKTPMAVLSRGVCGQRGKTLVLNLPGSPKGAAESFECIAGLIPHALDIMRGADHAPPRKTP